MGISAPQSVYPGKVLSEVLQGVFTPEVLPGVILRSAPEKCYQKCSQKCSWSDPRSASVGNAPRALWCH